MPQSIFFLACKIHVQTPVVLKYSLILVKLVCFVECAGVTAKNMIL